MSLLLVIWPVGQFTAWSAQLCILLLLPEKITETYNVARYDTIEEFNVDSKAEYTA